MKPAHEPIVVARKPLAGTVAANVLEHGTGALNVDGCRLPTADRWEATGQRSAAGSSLAGSVDGSLNVSVSSTHEGGRWPPNVLLSEEAAAELDRQSGTLTSGKMKAGTRRSNRDGWAGSMPEGTGSETIGDTGGASRFFPVFRYQAKAPSRERPKDDVSHPTVKPLELMKWLVRLVTPPGGIVLDPFAGTGTTGEACLEEGFCYEEGFRCILIEREPDYLRLIRKRLDTRTPTLWDDA